MESILLSTPSGISARLGWDPATSEHDRKRQLARELVASALTVPVEHVSVAREVPSGFGSHSQLFATVDGEAVQLRIRNTHHRAASVVAVSDPTLVLGLDLRDSRPDEVEVREMRRHSHLLEGATDRQLLAHWSRVQAIRSADARGARVMPEHVRLDSTLTRGWVPDRRVHYDLVDCSSHGWVITLAYAPVEVTAG